MKYSVTNSNLNLPSNASKKVAIVYFSKTGVIAKISKYIKKCLKSVKNIQVIEYRIDKKIIQGRFDNPKLLEELSVCQAIIFGTPPIWALFPINLRHSVTVQVRFGQINVGR